MLGLTGTVLVIVTRQVVVARLPSLIEARVLVLVQADPAVLLVDLVHAEAGCILVRQLELCLEPLAFATLRQVGTSMFVERLTHISRQVLRRVELGNFLLTLHVAEAGRVQKQARVLLHLLHQAEG